MRFFNGKEKRLQYEFLPAAEEIVETPPSPFGHLVVWGISILLIAAFAWSYFGKLDVIATAIGKITPEGTTKVVQAATAGVVREIKVHEGQKVKKGDVLVQLDSALAKKELEDVERMLTIAQLERDIRAKTLAGEDVASTVNAANIPDDVKQYLIGLAQSRVSAADAQRQVLSSGVSSAQQQVAGQQQNKQSVQSNIARLREREKELQKELENANILSEANIRSELRNVQQQIASAEASLASYDQQIAQMQLGVTEANDQLNARIAEDREASYAAIVDSEKRVTELQSAVARARQMVDQLTVIAPVDGSVLSLETKTTGGVVNAGQKIVEIVPASATLVVEATAQNKDIGFIHLGQSVVVKVDTYAFQRYGYLKGKVTNISPDAIVDEKQGLIYKIKIEIATDKTSKDQTIKIAPGMSVTAEITTGQRRIIEFFLDPLMTHTDASLEVR